MLIEKNQKILKSIKKKNKHTHTHNTQQAVQHFLSTYCVPGIKASFIHEMNLNMFHLSRAEGLQFRVNAVVVGVNC